MLNDCLTDFLFSSLSENDFKSSALLFFLPFLIICFFVEEEEAGFFALFSHDSFLFALI